MRPTNLVSNALRTSAFVAFSMASIASTAVAQRNLDDAGRLYRGYSATKTKAKNAAKAYNIFVTPTFGWTKNAGATLSAFGGQFKYASDDLIQNMPVAFSGTIMQNRFSATGIPTTSKLSTQLAAEVDVLSKPEYMLALSGSMNHMADVGTGLQFAPEFDWTLPKNEMFTGAIGGILYWDQFKPVGTTVSTSGTTLGIVAYLNHTTWGFIPEYDLASDWNGQEGVWSLKVSKGFANMQRDPRIIFGAARQAGVNSFLAGARLTLH